MRLRTILFTLVLAVTTSVSAKDYHFTTVKGDAMKTRIYTLDNGLTVYMSVNKELPRLQADIVVRTGSRNDPAETTGLAHYLEHLMFKELSNLARQTTPKRNLILTKLSVDMKFIAR